MNTKSTTHSDVAESASDTVERAKEGLKENLGRDETTRGSEEY